MGGCAATHAARSAGGSSKRARAAASAPTLADFPDAVVAEIMRALSDDVKSAEAFIGVCRRHGRILSENHGVAPRYGEAGVHIHLGRMVEGQGATRGLLLSDASFRGRVYRFADRYLRPRVGRPGNLFRVSCYEFRDPPADHPHVAALFCTVAARAFGGAAGPHHSLLLRTNRIDARYAPPVHPGWYALAADLGRGELRVADPDCLELLRVEELRTALADFPDVRVPSAFRAVSFGAAGGEFRLERLVITGEALAIMNAATGTAFLESTSARELVVRGAYRGRMQVVPLARAPRRAVLECGGGTTWIDPYLASGVAELRIAAAPGATPASRVSLSERDDAGGEGVPLTRLEIEVPVARDGGFAPRRLPRRLEALRCPLAIEDARALAAALDAFGSLRSLDLTAAGGFGHGYSARELSEFAANLVAAPALERLALPLDGDDDGGADPDRAALAAAVRALAGRCPRLRELGLLSGTLVAAAERGALRITRPAAEATVAAYLGSATLGVVRYDATLRWAVATREDAERLGAYADAARARAGHAGEVERARLAFAARARDLAADAAAIADASELLAELRERAARRDAREAELAATMAEAAAALAHLCFP